MSMAYHLVYTQIMEVKMWVWEFMEEQDQEEFLILLAKVYTTRIERSWRDIYRSVSLYAALFYILEVLDATNNADLFITYFFPG